MASEDRSGNREPAGSHEPHEWEAQKDNFYECYIVEDMKLKDATACMIERHGFRASVRQWERKARDWRFRKYVGQDTRRQQQEESQPGHSRDRNFKRWERRQRSRSVSSVRSAHSATDGPSSRPRGRSTPSLHPGPTPDLATLNDRPSEVLLNYDADGYLHPDPLDLPDYSNEMSSGQFDDTDSMFSSVRYDLEVPETSQQALRSSVPPDHFSLEATLHDPNSTNSPVQIRADFPQGREQLDASGQPGVPKLMLWSESGSLAAVPVDLSPHSGDTFQMPSDPLVSNQSTMSGIIPYYQQSTDSYEGDSQLSNENTQSNFDSQYDPAVDSPWINGIPEPTSSQNQPYNLIEFGGNDPASQPIGQAQAMSNQFVNFDAYTDDTAVGPQLPLGPASVGQSSQPVGLETNQAPGNIAVDSADGLTLSPLEKDFILRIGEHTQSVRDIVMMFAGRLVAPSELQELHSTLYYQQEMFSEIMIVTLKNFVTSFKRTQEDRDYTSKMRQQSKQLTEKVNVYRQILLEKGFDPDLELSVRSGFQGQPPLELSEFLGDVNM